MVAGVGVVMVGVVIVFVAGDGGIYGFMGGCEKLCW